ncbi:MULTISPECIES: DUF6317 family protein [Streptomycetaceae]|uniref:ESX-1 secretion-associated protein n=1 Tax=Streptantibioticus cattleyicolor (strain ATCC 35852 / DSM 46488 / JCM 4925 / NBRC 14057 / NRRL 8057) TaxID=1003195 RepID=F8JXD9_STREN|nr:DUF6317 family protein [Streptantibioticus cattleyicolor]AEW95819.1 hypothetical protein SCATT_34480 [Streptantibioticus cattleyicolor NRRL 8057 = DSM 46488]MYS60362.1 hypothetical protein [Streptomyces sp. SID5468]CCB76158.1 protein of unknown function [Streptantibioticus cattleyicolor NRRL 8057 = DSM 46488]
MTADLKAVLGDLKATGDAFHRAADDYRGLTPHVSPALADGGDPGLNDAIREVSDLIRALHTAFADRLRSHGDQVHHAHDAYQRQDDDTHQLFDDLMHGDGHR